MIQQAGFGALAAACLMLAGCGGKEPEQPLSASQVDDDDCSVWRGCFQDPQTAIRGPDGRQGFALSCSGINRSLRKCYREAGQLCPRGYDVIDRSSGVFGLPTSVGGVAIAPVNSLFIQCR